MGDAGEGEGERERGEGNCSQNGSQDQPKSGKVVVLLTVSLGMGRGGRDQRDARKERRLCVRPSRELTGSQRCKREGSNELRFAVPPLVPLLGIVATLRRFPVFPSLLSILFRSARITVKPFDNVSFHPNHLWIIKLHELSLLVSSSPTPTHGPVQPFRDRIFLIGGPQINP